MSHNQPPHTSFWEVLLQFPPYYVRLLAKRPEGPRADLAIEDAELAIRSGLPIDRIRQIASSENWDAITLGELLNFTSACNFDPMSAHDRKRVKQYLYVCDKRKKTPFDYLRHSPKWESEFLPLVKLLQNRYNIRPSPRPTPRAA